MKSNSLRADKLHGFGLLLNLLVVSLVVLVYPRFVLSHDVDVTRVARVFLDESVLESAVNDTVVNLPGAQSDKNDIYHYQYRLSIVDQRVPLIPNLAAILPQTCIALSSPTSLLSLEGDTYTFACEQALGLEDSLSVPWDLEGVVVLMSWSDGTQASAFFRGDGQNVVLQMGALGASAGSIKNLALSYITIGIEHILLGIDHLLFVMGLLLIVQGGWLLVKTITAFTIAHSVTLGLAVLGIVPVQVAAIEAVIALSIILLAREIIMGHRGTTSLVHSKPWLVAMLFGLVHGFGFAGALGALGLRSTDVPVALLFFNIGVEVGQLLFIALLLTIMALLRSVARPRMPQLESGFAYGLGGVAMFWFFERVAVI